MINTNTHNQNLAIVGLNINCGSNEELDRFERSIYEGEQYNNYDESNYYDSQCNIDIAEIVDKSIRNANIEANAKIAIIVAAEEKKEVIYQTELNNLPFTDTAITKNVFNGIEMAQKLLSVKEVDAVLICAANQGSIVLKLEEDARKKQQRIYAVINGLTITQTSNITAETVAKNCQIAINHAGIKPEDVNYLEICGNGIVEPNKLEIKGLHQAYQSLPKLSCAIGSFTAKPDNCHGSELQNLIKTVLCLYYRYIPAVCEWSKPKYPELWGNSPFYIKTQSKPWFIETETAKRVAAINSYSNGNLAHLILSEAASQKRDNRYLTQIPYYLFPLAANEQSILLEKLENLEKTISETNSLTKTATQTFVTYQKHQNQTYAVAILGRNKKELQREIQRALKGVKNAFETGENWKTPVGSYFTAKPLGKKGKVAFVYPGAYSSYIGIARNLFRLFPKIWDSPVIQNVYNRAANIEKFLYPRSLNALTKRQLESLEQQLMDSPLSMLESEVGFAGLMSTVLKDYFKLQPQACFGYSVGETSMSFAQGIWGDFSQTSSGLNSSKLFTSRLSGSKETVREYWGLTSKDVIEWGNYVLMANVSQVREQLKQEKRVYLTQINTPKEIVIAGDKAACQRVINAIGCNAISAPFNHVIHCEVMVSEYDELAKLHTLPIQNKSETDFYSAAEYGILNINSEVMGNSIAKVLCQQFDFPRLINRVYEDGARIFVEVGAGNTCSRWIGENLNKKEHATIFLNRRGVPEHTTLIRGLAQLVSHRVDLDLSPLYSVSYTDISKEKLKPFIQEDIWKQVSQPTLPKPQHKPLLSKSKNQTNNQIQNKKPKNIVTVSPFYWGKFNQQELHTAANFNYRNTKYKQTVNHHRVDNNMNNLILDSYQPKSSPQQNNTNLTNVSKLSSFNQNRVKQIVETNLQTSQSQAIFLKNRQSTFNQMVKMVELQISLLGNKE
ncbi:MAG: type I polyketide synthase [Rivularia sp. (in: Bacteria)]|nr:type I polyketide synthase [Rivularia sp. MS3]